MKVKLIAKRHQLFETNNELGGKNERIVPGESAGDPDVARTGALTGGPQEMLSMQASYTNKLTIELFHTLCM